MAQQEAAVADASARLANANIQLSRVQSLLNTPAGQRSAVDDATATQRSQAAQVMAAQAQLRMAQINLDYTEIHAPIGGKISRTAVTVGNVVSPSSGPLASIVSQDPMYVLFPIAVRAELDLENRYAEQGGMSAVVIRLRLPDGTMYDQTGKIDYVEPSVQATTDTILVRGKIANPPLKPIEAGKPVDRRLIDGEFVTVLVEGIEPIMALAIPRAAVLSDQQGDYVYVVDGQNKVEQRRIQLGQSTPTTAVILSGLNEGEMVVVDGIQRVRPGIQVAPGPPRRHRHTLLHRRRRDNSRMISAVFVDRPRLAIVIAIVMTLAGVLSLLRIPVAQFPDIVPPQVTVSTTYPGASAAVVEATVAQPLEAQIVGVDKMIYMKSNSGNDGSYSLTVSFELGTNPDIDTVNVNNRVQPALSRLPAEVQRYGVTVRKRSSAILEFLQFYSEGGKQDPLFISNYVTINVLDRLARTPGVGDALLFGRLDYSMRVWFDMNRLISLEPGAVGHHRRDPGAERAGARSDASARGRPATRRSSSSTCRRRGG